MELTCDLIKDDPCYGCKFAVLKTKEQIEKDGWFTRRFLCANMERRDKLALAAIKALSFADYDKALSLASTLAHLPYEKSSLLNNVSEEIIPSCRVEKEKACAKRNA